VHSGREAEVSFVMAMPCLDPLPDESFFEFQELLLDLGRSIHQFLPLSFRLRLVRCRADRITAIGAGHHGGSPRNQYVRRRGPAGRRPTASPQPMSLSARSRSAWPGRMRCGCEGFFFLEASVA